MSTLTLPRETGPIEVGPEDFDSMSLPVLAPHNARAWIAGALASLVGVTIVVLLVLQRADNGAQLEKSEALVGALNAQIDSLQNDLRAGATRMQAIDQQRVQLVADKAKHDQERDDANARAKVTKDALAQALPGEVDAHQVALAVDGARASVGLSGDVLFDVGTLALSARGQDLLVRLGPALANASDLPIEVAVHTDVTRPAKQLRDALPSSWELSAAQAAVVVRFLNEKCSVRRARLSAVGLGHAKRSHVEITVGPR